MPSPLITLSPCRNQRVSQSAVPRHGVQRLRHNRRLVGHSTLPSPYHGVRRLFSVVLFFTIHHVQLSRETIARHARRQNKLFEEKEQASQSDVAGMLELPGWGFKTARNDMPRVFNGSRREHAETDEWCKQRDGNPENEPDRNDSHQQHCPRNEERLWWAY